MHSEEMAVDILELLKSRRSHFRKEFTGEKVDDNVIKYLLKCAHQAPSHRLTLPWHFKIFSNNGLKKLSNKILEIHKSENPCIDDSDSTIQKINRIPTEASHVIAICMKRDKAERVPEIEEICATATAVENIYIGLLQYNDVGGYWCTGNKTYTTEMHNYLELEEKDKLLGFFFIGRVKNIRTKANRPPYEDRVEWIN